MTMHDGHPHQLLWYVAGVIDPPHREQVEAHLATCEGCRAEAASLASMMKSLVTEGQVDHLTSADLVRYEEGETPPDSVRHFTIRRHLDECESCRADLEKVARARRRELRGSMPASPVPHPLRAVARRKPRRGWMLGTAAGIVLLLAIGVAGVRRTAPPVDNPLEIQMAVFPAPVRGAAPGNTLKGAGPWAIRVLLSLDAPEGTYRVTLKDADGLPVPRLETTASTDQDRCLVVILPGLPASGRYEMLLDPMSGHMEAPLSYPFEYEKCASCI